MGGLHTGRGNIISRETNGMHGQTVFSVGSHGGARSGGSIHYPRRLKLKAQCYRDSLGRPNPPLSNGS